MDRVQPHARIGGLIAAAAVLASGCDVEVTTGATKRVPEQRLEQRISDTLTKQVGKRPQEVDCPRALKAEMGQTMRCVLTSDRARLGVTVTIDSIENGQVGFDIKVDEQPLPSSSG